MVHSAAKVTRWAAGLGLLAACLSVGCVGIGVVCPSAARTPTLGSRTRQAARNVATKRRTDPDTLNPREY